MVRNHFRLTGDTTSDYPTDLLAFSVIVYVVVGPDRSKVPMPKLLRTIARDATYYFLAIFSSHLVFVLTLIFARVRIMPSRSVFVFFSTAC